MIIHLYHQYFRYPDEGGAVRSFYLARHLLENGHEVVVFTAHNSESGHKRIHGISVEYLPLPYENQFGFGKRIRSFVKFVYLAIKRSKQYPKPDLNYVITTPLTTGFIALWLKKTRKIPYAFEVGDLWPEVPIQMGVIKNQLAQKWLYALERRIYEKAKHLIGLSPGIKDYIEYSCDFKVKAISIPNMSDCEAFRPHMREEAVSEKHPFQISYIGTFGIANQLETLIEFARLCAKEKLPVHFNLMGEGGREEVLKTLSEDLSNISWLPFGSHHIVKTLLENSDAIYVSFQDIPILGTGSPNKFFDGLAAGKLIIVNFEGWIKDLILENECGLYYPPEDPEDLLKNLISFIQSPSLLESYQSNARTLAEVEFERNKLLEDWMRYLEA
ncbi:MAG: glycosyltransferase family 4 protein [Cytophagales bacterium]|nr:glycosyltransferase family 4 protein [Cytophagales bacterium]